MIIILGTLCFIIIMTIYYVFQMIIAFVDHPTFKTLLYWFFTLLLINIVIWLIVYGYYYYRRHMAPFAGLQGERGYRGEAGDNGLNTCMSSESS